MKMSKIKNIIQILLIMTIVNGCQSVKEGISGKKVSKGEEFLIEKKNPLVVPEDFDVLPAPKNKNDKTNNVEEDGSNFKKLLEAKGDKKSVNTNSNTNTSAEDSILKKIKIK